MANSNLPPVWRFDFGDYTQLGPIFQKFLANVNLFTLAVYNILNGGIGFANMQRAIYSTTVTAATTTPLVFVNPLSIAPSGVSVVQVLQQGKTNVALTGAVSASNFYFDGKSINVLNITGLTAGNTYNLVLEIM